MHGYNKYSCFGFRLSHKPLSDSLTTMCDDDLKKLEEQDEWGSVATCRNEAWKFLQIPSIDMMLKTNTLVDIEKKNDGFH